VFDCEEVVLGGDVQDLTGHSPLGVQGGVRFHHLGDYTVRVDSHGVILQQEPELEGVFGLVETHHQGIGFEHIPVVWVVFVLELVAVGLAHVLLVY